MAFQAKCFNKLREIKGCGTTIVIVSHSLSQIEQICETSYWIDNGIIREFGAPLEVHPRYMQYMGGKTHWNKKQTTNNSHDERQQLSENLQQEDKEKTEIGSEEITEEKAVTINSVYLTNENNEIKEKYIAGTKVILNIKYTCKVDRIDDEIMVGLLIFRNDNVIAYGTNTKNEGIRNIQLYEKGKIQIEIENLNLGSGQYWIDVAIRKLDMFPYDYCSRGFEFNVLSLCNEAGLARLEHKWKF